MRSRVLFVLFVFAAAVGSSIVACSKGNDAARAAASLSFAAAGVQWAYQYTSSGDDVFGGVGADAAGNAVAIWWDGGPHSVHLEKRDRDGKLIWEKQYAASALPSTPSTRLLVEPDGHIEMALAPTCQGAQVFAASGWPDIGNGPWLGAQRARLDQTGTFVEGSTRDVCGASVEVISVNARGDRIAFDQNAWWIFTLVHADGTRVLLFSSGTADGRSGPLVAFGMPVWGSTRGFALFADGGVFTAMSPSNSVLAFVKLSSDGSTRWSVSLQGLRVTSAEVAIGPSGTAVVAGCFSEGSAQWGGDSLAAIGVDPTPSGFILTVNPDGTAGWARQLDGCPAALAADDQRAALAIAKDAGNSLVLATYDLAAGALLTMRPLPVEPAQFGISPHLAFRSGDLLVGGTFAQPFDFGAGLVTPRGADGFLLDLTP